LTYLEHFPNGVFADMARGRLSGLLQPVKVIDAVSSCKPPKPEKIKVKQTVKKAEPLKLRQEPPVFKKPKPKPPRVLKKPPKPPRTPPKRTKKPQVTEEEIPIIEEELEPEVEVPKRKRLPRFPRLRFRVPLRENPCPNNDC
jgi:hypothetical protein